MENQILNLDPLSCDPALRKFLPFVKKASSFRLEVSNNFADYKFGARGQRFIAATMETQRISTSFSY